MSIVYVIENKINGKCYVGQTIKSFSYRLYKHRRADSPIGLAIRKYGYENFKIEVMPCPEEMLDDMERDLIIAKKALVPNGYNLENGGKKNKHMSEDTKRKLRIINLGKKQMLSEETREKKRLLMIGNKYSSGRIHSEEEKAKRIKALTGNKYSLGYVHSKERNRKISLSLIGNKRALGKNIGNKNALSCVHTAEMNKLKSIRLMGNKNSLGKKDRKSVV